MEMATMAEVLILVIETSFPDNADFPVRPQRTVAAYDGAAPSARGSRGLPITYP
jgi:hypothetical protein